MSRAASIRQYTFALPLFLACSLLTGLLLAGCNGGGMEEEGPIFSSDRIGPGETFSFTFEDQGTEYYCTLHTPDMQGEVIVDPRGDSSGTAHVSMVNTSFEPEQITVQPGTEVIWTNNDDFAHTVRSGNP